MKVLYSFIALVLWRVEGFIFECVLLGIPTYIVSGIVMHCSLLLASFRCIFLHHSPNCVELTHLNLWSFLFLYFVSLFFSFYYNCDFFPFLFPSAVMFFLFLDQSAIICKNIIMIKNMIFLCLRFIPFKFLTTILLYSQHFTMKHDGLVLPGVLLRVVSLSVSLPCVVYFHNSRGFQGYFCGYSGTLTFFST